jgi:Tol biopolymer transport system component
MGTLGYMSPEQLRGKAVDHRSDIFAFGVILWEMLSGRRAFQAETAADTMMAILTRDPPELSKANPDVSPGLDRIVRHCLEKNVDERFHSASDLAFDLEALSGISTPRAAVAVPAAAARRPTPRILPAAAAVIAAALVGFLSYRAGKSAGHTPPPSFHQLTFQRGELGGAFFAPDGHTIVYSGAWEGKPRELFVHRLESPESRPFGSEGDLLSMSRTSELAVLLNRRPYVPFVGIGRLARIPLAGGAPREILDDVQWADWSPDGRELAIVRDVGAHNRLEFPIGKMLYETTGWISHPRVSPDGGRVAFIDHPILRDDGGSVAVVDREGKKTNLTPVYSTCQGLAWTPDGRETWFTAAEEGYNRAIHAVNRSGRDRLVNRVAGVSTIKDISQDGRVLMSQDITRQGMLVGAAGERSERELSWLDWSVATDLSPDGKTVLFFEGGEAGGLGYVPYLRKTDGSPAIRLGEGNSQGLSPDGRWALCIVHSATDAALVAVPTGVGETRSFPKDGLHPLVADWFPDGKRILMTATEPNRGMRLYVRDFGEGKPRPLSPEGYRQFERAVSPDGRLAAVRGPDRRLYLYPLEGGEPTALSGLTADDVPVRFDREGRWLYVYRQGSIPLQVDRYEISSGRRERWKEVTPADTAGLSAVNRFVPTPDGQAYAYSYIRILSYLQLVDGLK